MAESTFRPSPPGSAAVDPRMAPVELPAPRTLSEPQRRGRACVWCAVTLTPQTAIDLGERREVDSHGSLRWSWFPRGCRACAGVRCYRALLDHSASCEQCADEPALCATGRAMRTILRAVRR